MGVVAVKATFAVFQGFVFESDISEISALVFMAIKTEFIAWFQQDKLVVWAVGIMTTVAISFDHNLMRAEYIFRQYLFVAVVAKLCFICLQQTFVWRGVGNMAADAFPFFQQRVDKTIF